MQFEQDNDTYIIYLEKDERIMTGLTQSVSYTHLTLPTKA